MNLISEMGRINGVCTKANVSWQILKYPGEMKYHVLITPVSHSKGAMDFEYEYIDDLIDGVVEKVQENFLEILPENLEGTTRI